MNKIILSKSVIGFLDKKSDEFVKDFYEKIKVLEDEAFTKDKLNIKKIKDKKNRYRLRISKHKFLFEVID